MKKQLLASSVFRFIERFIVVITSLLLTPFLINTLGEHQYGLWILIISVLGWFNVINLGFPSAVQRHITLALEREQHEQVSVVFSTSLLLFGGLGLLAAASLLMLIQFPAIFGLESADQPTLVFALTIFALKVFWDFLMNAIHGFFAGLLRYDIDANISSLNAITKALLVLLLVSELQIMGAIIATLAADFIANILKVIYAKRIYPKLRFSPKNASWAEVKSLFSFSKHVIAAGIAQSINTKADPIIVTRLFDLPSVALYSVASRLTSHVQAFIGAVTGIFAPVFTKMAAKNKNMEQMFLKTITINLFVATSLFLPLMIFGGVFIKLWVGDAFAAAIPLLGFLVFSLLCLSVSDAVKNVLFAQANHKLLTIINLIGAIFNIILSVALAKKYGLIGIAMGTAFGFFISDIVCYLFLLRKYNNYRLGYVFKQFFFAALLIYGVGLIGQQLVTSYMPQGWLALMVASLVCFPLILLLNWFVILTASIRQQVISTVQQKISEKRAKLH